MSYYLTVRHIKAAMSKYRYIAVRDVNGNLIGINCGMLPIMLKHGRLSQGDDWEVAYTGWMPISFNEYINIKYGFA